MMSPLEEGKLKEAIYAYNNTTISYSTLRNITTPTN